MPDTITITDDRTGKTVTVPIIDGIFPSSAFRDLDKLITASKKGFPAAERILDDLTPLLAQVDPATRQLIPILQFLGDSDKLISYQYGEVHGGDALRVRFGSTSFRMGLGAFWFGFRGGE